MNMPIHKEITSNFALSVSVDKLTVLVHTTVRVYLFLWNDLANNFHMFSFHFMNLLLQNLVFYTVAFVVHGFNHESKYVLLLAVFYYIYIVKWWTSFVE